MTDLYTTKEIAEMYNISTYAITHNWCNKGLKHIRGRGTFLFTTKWIDEWLEEEAERVVEEKIMQQNRKVIKPTKSNGIGFIMPKSNKEMKII